MRRSRFRVFIFLLILVLACLSSPVFASNERTASAGQRSPLAMLWRAIGALIPSLAESGPGMDPWGGPNWPATPDSGPGMDPWG